MDDKTDLSWFVPEDPQKDFITWWGKETVYAGGVGSGKTLSGAFKALVAATQWPGGVGLVGRQTYRALEDTTKKVMLDGDDKPPVIPPELIVYRNDLENRIVLKGGSEILFRSLESHNIEKLLSLNLAWAFVDELVETTLKVWLTLLGRLRHPAGPRCAWGTTNPNGHDWVWSRFHPDGGDNVGKLIIQPTDANKMHLSPDYIDMLDGMPKEWQKRYRFASFDTAAGAIWDMWHRDVHVFDHDVVGQLPFGWKRFRAMDHGRRNPTCVLWFVVDNDGNLIVEDEYYVEDKLPRDHAVTVLAKDGFVAHGVEYHSIIAPPDCFRVGANAQTTVADEYRQAAGLALTPANDNVEAGLYRVADWLTRSEQETFPEWHPFALTTGPDKHGAPRLFVSNRCENLIREIPNYQWRDISDAVAETRSQPEEPQKKDDHACDALRYGVMSRPRPRALVVDKTPDHRVEAVTVGLLNRRF